MKSTNKLLINNYTYYIKKDKKSSYSKDFISFWDYIQFASKNGSSTLKKLLKNIEKLPDVHTHDGKGRAWIRAILNENLIISAFEMLINERNKEKYVEYQINYYFK